MKRDLMLLLAILALSVGLTVTATAYIYVKPDSSGGGLYKPAEEISPEQKFDVHNVGKIAMTIVNDGTFGTGFVTTPYINGEEAPSCEYPINSNISYLFGASLWIGAVVGHDTLVSVGEEGWGERVHELQPDTGLSGDITSRSSIRSKPNYDPNAISDQDFSCAFSDTFTEVGITGQDGNDNRAHIPINIAVKMNTYAWSYEYAEDFILMDYKITNIGRFPIKDMYVALYVDADVHAESVDGTSGASDDLCGFRRTVAATPGSCFPEDTVNIAWIADQDGDPLNGAWDLASSTPAVTGTRVLRSPNEDLQYSFNWWMSASSSDKDFGPRMAGTAEKPFRPFPQGNLGTPTGDKIKYYVMSDGEFDYDQLYSAVSHETDGFLPVKPEFGNDYADGGDTRYLLSFGPFDVDPNDTLPVTVAYIAGDNFHVGPNDWKDNFNKDNPDVMDSLFDFEELGKNAIWASKIFDNYPGVDTDGDGDSGKYCIQYIMRDTFYVDTICCYNDTCMIVHSEQICDSINYDSIYSYIADSIKVYYAGDGVPDFRGAAPPDAPKIKLFPEFGKVTIRWNGQVTENKPDPFSTALDFEGYRVYYGEDNRQTDFVLLSSYDIEDYKVFTFDAANTIWQQTYDLPLTLDSLQSKYGRDFDPKLYNSEANSFIDGDSAFYFLPQDWNQSDFSNPSLIHKVYPNASKHNRADTTEEGYLRYYEYEYTIDNLQPSKPYYFAVTAFDYGSVKADMGSLESSVLNNAAQIYPLPTADVVEENASPVMIYPNPYRIDGNYANIGYENRDRTHSVERARRINFANLPGQCTIRIFTLAGDLIKEISHTNGTSEDYWDVISRNTQPVVTGIYIWHIESDMGEQIGKLVIIK